MSQAFAEKAQMTLIKRTDGDTDEAPRTFVMLVRSVSSNQIETVNFKKIGKTYPNPPSSSFPGALAYCCTKNEGVSDTYWPMKCLKFFVTVPS